MADTENTVPNTIKSITSVINGGAIKKVLTDTNFEVTGVSLAGAGRDVRMVNVKVVIDLANGNDSLPMVSTDRYSKRSIPLQRISLRDILEYRNIPRNKLGQYVIAATDAAGIKSALNVEFAEGELEVRKVGDLYVVSAAPDCYGFYGSFTITASSEGVETPETTEPEEKPETPTLTAVAITGGANLLELNGTTTFGYTLTPNTVTPTSVEFKAVTGTIDAAGKYTAKVVGKDTITLTVDGVSATKEVTVQYATVTDVKITAPTTLVAGESATITAVIEPANVDPAIKPTFTAALGMIDTDGSYIAPSEAGTEVITVVAGSVTKTANITITVA